MEFVGNYQEDLAGFRAIIQDLAKEELILVEKLTKYVGLLVKEQENQLATGEITIRDAIGDLGDSVKLMGALARLSAEAKDSADLAMQITNLLDHFDKS